LGQRLGQHFLFDSSILGRIADAACVDAGCTVIEIGPGPGGLTERLLTRCERLIAIELDPALAAGLRERFGSNSKFHLIESDVLKTDLAQWGPVAVAGNIPYYITSPIVEKALSLGPLLRRAVFLVQKEVADRIAAQPGSRDYGYLSVTVQARSSARVLFNVKPGSFRPPPKVDSAVIQLDPLARPVCEDIDGFLQFASACFRQKRKTLRNNLSAVYDLKRATEGGTESPAKALQKPALAATSHRHSPEVGRGEVPGAECDQLRYFPSASLGAMRDAKSDTSPVVSSGVSEPSDDPQRVEDAEARPTNGPPLPDGCGSDGAPNGYYLEGASATPSADQDEGRPSWDRPPAGRDRRKRRSHDGAATLNPIDLSRRAEQLSVSELVRVFDTLKY
jgi:16S rRNA (adenine1518-N6/adenine1519-N6)-dimethyltransferase